MGDYQWKHVFRWQMTLGKNSAYSVNTTPGKESVTPGINRSLEYRTPGKHTSDQEKNTRSIYG